MRSPLLTISYRNAPVAMEHAVTAITSLTTLSLTIFSSTTIEVTHEPRVPHGSTFLKPDLVVVKDSTISFIIDTAICNTNRHPDEVYKNKVDKYKHCTDFVKQIWA